jgi:twitching motility protein PilT
MSNEKQQLLKRIIVHNKLLSEQDVDDLLSAFPEPTVAVKQMVQNDVFSAKKGAQVLNFYQKELAKRLEGAEDGAEPDSAEATSDSSLETEKTPEKPSEKPPARPKRDLATKIDSLQFMVDLGGIDLMHQLLQAARDLGASDLHIKSEMQAVVRVGGRLHNLNTPPLTHDVCELCCHSLLTDAQLERFQSTNDLDFCYEGEGKLGRFRANLLREHRGIDGVFRPIANRVSSFEELNLPPIIKKLLEYRVGIILITGPKGSGKTTTLAAMIDRINAHRQEHIITLEDPIEFVHPCKEGHVNQRQVGEHTLSFSNALRAALREAPDVIMVGEMRDLETTSLAITAAETGHLVLATLHTPDAIRTIGRVLDVFPAKEQAQVRAMISESLRGIVSQLLIPSSTGDSMELATEVLINTQAIGHLIREDRVFQVRGLMQTGKRLGMTMMDESLIKLAQDNKISKEDAIAHAEEVAVVEKALSAEVAE